MKRIPQLDGVRGMAVLMVFAYHALHVPLLWAGVDLFFVLSGYLITGVLMRLKETRSLGGYWSTFYMRRAVRIAPPYIGFIVILSLLWYWYAFFGANFASAFGKSPVHALSPIWSLAVEEQFYFIWPWLVLLCDRRTLRKVAIGVMIAAPILRGIFTPIVSNRGVLYDLMPFRMDSLACGALIAICAASDSKWIERGRGWSVGVLWISGLLLMGLSAFSSFRLNANSEFFNILGFSLIVLFFGAGLVWTLGMQDGFWRKLFVSWPLRYMGVISYTFYLYQVAVMDKIAVHVHSRAEIAVLGFLITALFSTLSWHFFESRILQIRFAPRPEPLQTGAA
jgi:peptidoglycan/LPS O-acetylase OafA/YrhL